MAKNYGDIPCIRLNETIHITKSGTKCLCGISYKYAKPNRENKSCNIIWRELEVVNCEKCKKLYDSKAN